ncbi:hypothetical protein ES288_A11G220600v1 [Gossypium darwinii]|uniref:RING-type E3 ubiquitin transferase n=1 Tax=Gossypium darwinii TaxID=34276 RepID=A0A5D2EME2_GOSDA|nr:hypothetical protein ES288_A11G220600v1 [Gossypium darwinii]
MVSFQLHLLHTNCMEISFNSYSGKSGKAKISVHKNGTPAETEPCCICQEDYANGEELGKLDCGHDFHFSCIKQWLVQKNSCPICKKTALAI